MLPCPRQVATLYARHPTSLSCLPRPQGRSRESPSSWDTVALVMADLLAGGDDETSSQVVVIDVEVPSPAMAYRLLPF